MDANKVKQQVKTPPIVWQSEYNTSSQNEIDLMNLGYHVYSSMASQYPVNNFYSTIPESDYATNSGNMQVSNSYLYTGLCYDFNEPNKVVYVYPESPAENAGIRVGDNVVSVNGRLMPKSVSEMENDFMYRMRAAIEDKKPASVLDNPSCKAGFSYILGDYTELQKNIPLQFVVERAGNSQTFLVNPQEWAYASSKSNLYKIKETPYEEASKRDKFIAMGLGLEIPQNPLFFPSGVTPVNGPTFYFAVDAVTSRNWRMVNDYAISWFNTGLYNGYKSNLLECKWTIGPGFKIFPNFYITASVAFGGYFFMVDNNDALSQSIFKVYFMPGFHYTIAHSLFLFGRYNMSSGTTQSIDFGLKVRL